MAVHRTFLPYQTQNRAEKHDTILILAQHATWINTSVILLSIFLTYTVKYSLGKIAFVAY